jgi:hypothetical protein
VTPVVRAACAALVGALGVAACGGAPLRVGALDDMERVRATPAAQEGEKLAPEVYARAEHEREAALQTHAAGDDVGAALHADRAVAAYDHARTVARLARARSRHPTPSFNGSPTSSKIAHASPASAFYRRPARTRPGTAKRRERSRPSRSSCRPVFCATRRA